MGPFDNELWEDKTGQFFAKTAGRVDFAFELADDFGRQRLREPSPRRAQKSIRPIRIFRTQKARPQKGVPCR
jgi:hypothetical protein